MAEEKKSESSKESRFKPDDVISSQRNKQLTIVTVLVVLLGIACFVTAQYAEETGQLEEQTLIAKVDGDPVFVKEDIDGIQIWKGKRGEKFTLNRDGDEWVVPTRYNAPAAESDVDSLIQRLFDAKHFNQPATTDQSQYLFYRLTDDEAAHLRLVNGDGEELLHIMIGKSDAGTRDFIRFAGKDAPEGIFELTGMGGSFDTIHSALNLDAEGEPQPKKWLDLSGFQPLPYLAVTQRLAIKDKDRLLEFSRKKGSDPADDEWVMTSPHVGDADGAGVRGLVDALMNYPAQDIAGKSGLDTEDAERQVIIEYELEGETGTTRLFFGERKDGKVAVRMEGGRAGGFVYWTGDFMLERLYKPTSDFMMKVRLRFLPEDVDVERISITDEGTTTELAREKTESMTPSWKLESPIVAEAEYNAVSGLLRALSGLQGYKLTGDQDYEQHGVGEGISERWVTISYPEKGDPEGGDEDGDGEDDTPEGEGEATEDPAEEDQPSEEQPAEEQPTEEPAEEEPAQPEPAPLKTARLYFGKTEGDEVSVLMVIGEQKTLYRVATGLIGDIFREPGLYAKLEPVKLTEPAQSIEEIRITNGEEFLHVVHEEVAEGGGKRWQMKAPAEEQAAQTEILGLLRNLENLEGLPRAEGLNKDELGLGDDATRMIDLRIQDGEESQLVTVKFGDSIQGLTSVLVARADGSEEFFLAHPNDVSALMVNPEDYRNFEDFSVKVRHILVSWKGKSPGVNLKDPARTEAEARALAQELKERAEGGEDFVELQQEYNEDDSDATAVYPVDQNTSFVRPFKRLASQLEVDEIGIVESQFGMHVIKRIE